MKIVEIDFGGTLKKPKHLKFGVGAFTAIEELTGKSISEMDMNTMSSLFILVTAGLLWEDHKLTVDKVQDMVDKWSEKLAEENNVPFFEGMTLALEELSNLVGKAMGNDDIPNDKKRK